MKYVLMLLCVYCWMPSFAQPIQYHYGSGDNVINKYVIYKTIYNNIKTEEDRSLLFLGFQIAELRWDSVQPKQLKERYTILHDLCINSLKKGGYASNKAMIVETLNDIYKQQGRLFKEQFVKKSDKEYQILKQASQVKGVLKFSYGVYEGVVVNGNATGIGTLTYNNGSKYVGQFRDNIMHGFGVLVVGKKDIYMGSFKRGVRDGYGIGMLENGDVYEGQYKNDLRDGLGKYTYPNGDFFWGEFIGGKQSAGGVFSWHNGLKYIGDFNAEMPDGFGTLTSKSFDLPGLKGCRKYVGNFSAGKRHGFGRCYDNSNQLLYEGQFFNDDPLHTYPSPTTAIAYKWLTYNKSDTFRGYVDGKSKEGYGVYKDEGGNMYEGEWKNDSRHGVGVFRYANGAMVESEFKYGALNGYGTFTDAAGATIETFFQNDGNHALGIYSYPVGARVVGLSDQLKMEEYAIIRVTQSFSISYCATCRIYIGEMKHGLKNGYGICFDDAYDVVYEGLFEDDLPIDTCPQKKL